MSFDALDDNNEAVFALEIVPNIRMPKVVVIFVANLPINTAIPFPLQSMSTIFPL